MILRGKFSPRRKALLVLVLIVLAWLGYAWYANIAITRGIEQKDMDWNGDGTVSRDEIIESFYAVAVNDSQDGNRHCRTFVWRSTGEQIRVDCRTEFKAAEDKPAEAKK
ncbi:EF-hand domain-containing protein [Stenotrophomonas geniculata]|uniref:EF-hand domain-containing protein n=1 Tax=Stenotrophomonas geniculata TaxID=86188 RepID=UPI002E75F6F2|nr:EF-hand domain-containing protein [Stenotrophomonas geniculata]